MLKSSSGLCPRITIPSFFDEGNDAGGDNDELDSFIADDDFDDSGRSLDNKTYGDDCSDVRHSLLPREQHCLSC